MALPLDLIFVRHGQSEGNVAKRLSEKGDHSAFELLQKRHTRSYRLSKLGREQAEEAGLWLRQEFYDNHAIFDRCITSEYTRAMETSALLKLPNATWHRNFYLSERDWGDLDMLSEVEREEKFGHALEMRLVEPFYWRPPNGESFANLCLRLDRVLHTLHRECSDKKVIVVCHGEVMRAFRVLIERMSQQQFKASYLSKESDDGVHNCEIMHYSRKNPETGMVEEHTNWIRRVRPTDSPVWNTGWQKIERPKYSNDDLLRIVSETPNLIE